MHNPFPHTLILGHRGAPFDTPENTLRAFSLAMAHGADGVELDVRAAADGVPVVIHDDSLNRTMPAHGRVADHAWPALERMTGATLPSLEQAAAWAAAAGAWLNVEMKEAGIEQAALDILQRMGLLERSFLSSFDAGVVAEIGRICPAATRFLLLEDWDAAALDSVARSNAQGVCLKIDAATPLVLEVLRNERLPVVVWTVDAPTRMRELLGADVAGIITNRPRVAAEVRAEPRPPH